jgi:hypothetical protein
MPILLWHLPLIIFFGLWDVAVSPSQKRSVEAPFDARLAPETPDLPLFGRGGSNRSEPSARPTARAMIYDGASCGRR